VSEGSKFKQRGPVFGQEARGKTSPREGSRQHEGVRKKRNLQKLPGLEWGPLGRGKKPRVYPGTGKKF